jgi:hypothetical protein
MGTHLSASYVVASARSWRLLSRISKTKFFYPVALDGIVLRACWRRNCNFYGDFWSARPARFAWCISAFRPIRSELGWHRIALLPGGEINTLKATWRGCMRGSRSWRHRFSVMTEEVVSIIELAAAFGELR